MTFLRNKGGSADKIERDLAVLNRARDRLRVRVESTAAVLQDATNERCRILIESDADDSPALAKSDRACSDARDRHSAVVDALSTTEVQIAEVELALAAERQRVEREKTAEEIRRRAAAIEVSAANLSKAALPFGRCYSELLSAIRGFGLLVGDFNIPIAAEDHARAIFLSAVRNVAPGVLPGRPDGSLRPPAADACAVAAELQVAPLRALADRILAGEVPAELPDRPRAFVPMVAPKTTLVLSESISWHDETGRLVHANEGGVEIPVPVADAAVARGIGYALGSARAVQILTALRGGSAAGSNNQTNIVRRGPPWTDMGVNLYEWAEAERAARRNEIEVAA